MEREAKYRAVGRIRAKQVEALDLAPYALGERRTHDLRDTVLDTAERTLSGQRYGLRVRHDGGASVLTLKSPGTVTGATHERGEIEAPISAAQRDDPASWPAAIAEPLAGLIGAAPLAPLLAVRNRRRAWNVARDGELVAELALDRGRIEANGRSLPFHEIEIELKGAGTAADLIALETLLTASLPLVPEPRSKMARGVQLLNHDEHHDALKQAGDRTPMAGGAALAEAGRAILAKHLSKLHAAWPIARAGSDPEGVHMMRVATRRLRAVLASLGESVYEQREVARLRRGLRTWAAALGAVRDTDVFLEALDGYEADHPAAAAAYGPLRALLNDRRATARATLIALLESKKAARFAQRLDEFVLGEGTGVRETDEDGAIERTLVRHWAGGILWTHYERVRAYESVIDDPPIAALHRLRIEVKHLRYTLELFRDALAEEAESLHEQLVTAQDHLGALQDAEVAIAVVDDALGAGDSAGLRAYRDDRVADRDRLARTAPAVVAPIFGLPFRRRLASLIAKL